MLLQELEKKKLIHPPEWLACNTHFLTIMGSFAYGCSSDTSDMDLYGWCIPKKEMVFPHLAGKVLGFDEDLGLFDKPWLTPEGGATDENAMSGNGRKYDIQIFGIVQLFSLLTDNNPNIIDSLFTPENCVLHCTRIGTMVRDNRKMFLHKGAWHRFKGYAYSQLKKMDGKKPKEGSKRQELREEFGFDVKFAYHIVRLINEVEQIMATGDLDLQLNNECLKAIRRGEWTQDRIRQYFVTKEKTLEVLYNESKLPYGPDRPKIKRLLMHCLEEHFGSLDKAIVNPDASTDLLREIKALLVKNGV